MGTRHRAALGISEETDAVVLVVSEESGRISLAVGGHMESPLDREALRGRLGELFDLAGPPAPRRTGWWLPPGSGCGSEAALPALGAQARRVGAVRSRSGSS